MRTTVIFLIALFSEASFAAKTSPSILSIRVKGPYATQRTDVVKEGAEWVCKTELTPGHYSKVQPFSKAAIAKLPPATKSTSVKSCRDAVVIVFREQGGKKEYAGCANELGFSQFLSELNKNCGRN